MTQPIIPRDEVAAKLAVTTRVLTRYESRGLVHSVKVGSIEGYGPAEVRRLWSIVTYQRDLGINLAGVEAILKLRDHMTAVHHRLDDLADRLRLALDEESTNRDDA